MDEATPWLEVEADYVTKGMKPRDLAVKYGVAPEEIHRKAFLLGWKSKREEIARKLQEAAVEAGERALHDLTTDADEILHWLRQSRPIPQQTNLQDARAWVGAWNSAWNKKLRALGLPETINKTEQAGKIEIVDEVTFDLTAAPKEDDDEGEYKGDAPSEAD